jgi:predicted deacylase
VSLPVTYDECRARFRQAAEHVRQEADPHPITAIGPQGQALTVDTVCLGAARPARGLVVMSGVHGVEGFVGSALQCDLLERIAIDALPGDVGVLFIHAVNPWGMAWGRRQNESNVDLNRNWQRDAGMPFRNEAYATVHPLVCPDSVERPSVDRVMAAVNEMARASGAAWVRDAITVGQYTHPDGLHYGGARTEASTRIVETVVGQHFGGVERLLTIDLHTGHGPAGVLTLLCDSPPGSPQHQFLAGLVGADAVEVTRGNAAATTATKAGQIANGFVQLLPEATSFATSAEFGTVSDGRQLVMTVLEQWAHRHGRRCDPNCRDIVDGYRKCFTPENADWIARCMRLGRDLLDASVCAVCEWPRR